VPRQATILTIEDESAVRSGIVAYLEDSGFRMLEADNGLLGLQLFRRQRPDVVLCDLRLPGLDGLELISTLSAEGPEVPVIVVSGVSLVSEAVQALKRGAWDFITKPIPDMGVLERAVRRALERAELVRENRSYREGLEVLNRELTRTLQQFKADQEAGRKTQFQLLPQDNRVYGDYRFTRRLYPSMYLSGDFLDYFPIDRHHVGFYMADVSGHGAASAFVTVMLKTLMSQYSEAWRAQADETILHPAGTLERLDRDLRRQHLDKYLTIFYGVIDRKEQSMACSNGGQFPHPILYDGRAARVLACPSRPVGLFPDSRYQARTIALPDAFILLLVSDGILEILPQPSLAEKREVLRSQVQSLDATLTTITDGLGLEKQAPLPDDIALLMVSRQPGHG
jgi:sigma-B regulation protein RsbU (phosphoserine phosphatase)